MSFLWLTIGSLVVWRITHLIQAEDGPWNIIVHLRRFAGASILGQLMDCFYCLSLWVSAPIAYYMGNEWSVRFWLWPALSGAAILLERVTDRHQSDMRFDRWGESDDVMLRKESSSGFSAGTPSPEVDAAERTDNDG
jgi:hypothetical protein